MDLFQSTSSSNPTFARLRDGSDLAQQRAFINRMYNDQFEPYADKDFSSKFPLECLSRFWEMYLGCALLNRGFKLVPRKNRPRAGPDFCIEQDGSPLWIEAVTPDSGTGTDSVLLREGEPPARFQQVPEDQIILRFCSAIRDKHCGHLRHLSDGLVSANDSFLIAINGAGIPMRFWDTAFSDEIPYAIRAVLPLGQYSVTVDRTTKQVVKAGFEHRTYIVKLSGSPVPTNSFLDCTFSLVSGLLFSNIHPFFCNNVSLGSLSLLQNYSPLHAVPEGWLGSGVEWRLKRGKDRYVLKARRIIATA